MTDRSEFDDIPGTVVFTPQQCRLGYRLNQFCTSLMQPENRARFQGDEAAYLDQWDLTPAQRRAVLERDYNAAIAEGGNIHFLAKLISSDGQTMMQAASSMSGMTAEEYAAMMLAGGRSPDGWRSVKEGY
jgi:protocatechuate 4,5-dioxygenase, alpha chain